MKKHQLKPGIYKIRKVDHSNPYGAKHPRPNNNQVRLLRVVNLKNELRYYLDLDHIGFIPSVENMQELEIVSHYDGDPSILNIKISIEFQDSSGTQFKYFFSGVKDLINKLNGVYFLRKLLS